MAKSKVQRKLSVPNQKGKENYTAPAKGFSGDPPESSVRYSEGYKNIDTEY